MVFCYKNARTTEEKIRICLFYDLQKSHKGKHHTELICIIIGSFIKVMWFRYNLDLDLAAIQDSKAFRLFNSKSRSIDI